MEKVVVPGFAQGEAEPKNRLQEHLDRMIDMTNEGRWQRDLSDVYLPDGRTAHCTMGMVVQVVRGY